MSTTTKNKTTSELIRDIVKGIKEFGTSEPTIHNGFTHYNLLGFDSEDYFGKFRVYIYNHKVYVRYFKRWVNSQSFDIVKQWNKREIEMLLIVLGFYY